jgi:hypothetical protein
MRRQNYGNGVSAGRSLRGGKIGSKTVSPQSITLVSGTLVAQKFCALNQNPRDMRQLEVFQNQHNSWNDTGVELTCRIAVNLIVFR